MLDVSVLYQRLEAYSLATLADTEPRWHLGASEIGDECTRRSWLKFRWVKQEFFDGRMLRLFRRGHEEEVKLAAILEAIGVRVQSLDESTGKQHRFSAVLGHFGGARDGVGECDLLPGVRFLIEYKTHGDKYFKQIAKSGVRKAREKHYKQMSSYGRAAELRYGLYVAINKNTDEIHFEFVELDWGQADADLNKAEQIVTSQIPFPRISGTPTYYVCRMCFLSDICHKGEPIDKNCRSCVSAVAAPDGQWYCTAFQQAIPREFVPHGCGSWRPII